MTLNAASVTYASKTVWNIRKQAKLLLNLVCVLNVASKKNKVDNSCWTGKKLLVTRQKISGLLAVYHHSLTINTRTYNSAHCDNQLGHRVRKTACKISSCVLACNNSCCRLREGLKWFTKSLHTDACKYNVKEFFQIYRRSYLISALAALSPNKFYFILSEAEDMDWFTF